MTQSSSSVVAASGQLQLGSLTVHRLGYGTMQLPGRGVWGPPKDPDEAIRVLRRVVELGVDLIDTADSYGPDVAEDLIREALHPYPTELRIATKAGFTRSGPDQWTTKGDPAYLRRQCDSSLQRLGVERIDLFQLHRIDSKVAAEDQFGVLRELRDEGKVAEVGLSEVGIGELEAARAVVPIVSVQNLYNLGNRGADDLVDHCAAAGIGFIPWFPLASGKLAQPGGPLDVIAADLGATPAQVCLAWLLQRSPVMLPIPGTSTILHAESNCAAAGLRLSQAQFDELSEARRALRRVAFT
jgi:aryl-alcohol dehydrogenase-like predicted oxidoreductase